MLSGQFQGFRGSRSGAFAGHTGHVCEPGGQPESVQVHRAYRRPSATESLAQEQLLGRHPKARLSKACGEHEQKVTASHLFRAWSCGMSSVNYSSLPTTISMPS